MFSKRYFKQFYTSQRGFTLIELLVVVAIISLLASIVLVSLNSARQKARDARRIADIRTIQQALVLYFDTQNLRYPATMDDLKTKNILAQIPKDPSRTGADENYKYACLTDATSGGNQGVSYHLAAILEDTNHSVLQNKANANVSANAKCAASADDFNGQTSGYYDVKP